MVEQLARTKTNLRIVGVGAQDTLDAAKKFMARAAIKKVIMLWDGTGSSWNYWGVSTFPSARLVDAYGKVVRVWTGELNIPAVIASAGV